MTLAETYRPQAYEELLGQSKAVKKVQAIQKRGPGGRAYWIAGQSGTGKTSLAYLIAGQLTQQIVEGDSRILDTATLSTLEEMQHTTSFFAGEPKRKER